MKDFFMLRNKKISVLYEKRSIKICLLMLLLTLISLILSISIGKINISPLEVIKVFIGIGDKRDALIINALRLPRALVGFLVGASLGLSGAILQGVIKNPLASPNLIGIVDGGSVGALIFLTLFTNPINNSLTVSIFYMPVFTFLSSLISVAIIYVLAYKKGVTPFRLILVGIGISGAAKAITNILIVSGPPIFIATSNLWLTGTIYGSNWTHVKLLSLWFIVFACITYLYTRELNIQSLEDNISISLGTKLEKNRFILLILSAALASGAVAIGGGISFVGLIAPHICRKLTNSSFENLIPLSILVGGIIVILSDIAARTLFYPLDLPVGIFTAAIGAPFFIFLLWKNRQTLRRGN